MFADQEIPLDLTESQLLFDPAARFIHVPEEKFNSMRNVMNTRILERLKAANFPM